MVNNIFATKIITLFGGFDSAQPANGQNWSFLRKQESISLNFHSWGWVKFAHKGL